MFIMEIMGKKMPRPRRSFTPEFKAGPMGGRPGCRPQRNDHHNDRNLSGTMPPAQPAIA
jgi:hypothetical protein